MNHLVLSGTATHVPSGTGSSCYRGPKPDVKLWRPIVFHARNFPKLESFGFLLTNPALSAAASQRPWVASRARFRAGLIRDAGRTMFAARRARVSARQGSCEGAIA